jgi:stearoyl-CoA desaturase (delta-9 desaturase)
LSTLIATMTSLPYKQFRRNRFFYLWYDGTYAVLILAALALMFATGWQGVVTEWSWSMMLWFPVVLYTQIIAHVFVHNATHKSWPRAINRLMGELCGVWVLTRFASWEVVHQRHHQYSDDPDKDPHPVIPNFWRFALNTIVNVESQLQQAYYDAHGDTPENRRYERLRAVVSFAVGMMLIYAWLVFWGPAFFFAVFLPAAILGGLHVLHFNWSTHNGFSPTHDFRPVNLDHGVYWLGNRIFFGIYYHANHHRRPSLFNPQHMKPGLPLEPAPRGR